MQKIKHGQGSIIRRNRPRPDGSVYTWYQGMFRGITVTATTYKDCNKKLSTLRQSLKTKIKKSSETNFLEWINKCLSVYKTEVAPITIKNYESVIKNHVQKELKTKPVSKIKVSELQQNINDVAKEHGRTAKRLYDLYTFTLDKAYHEGLIERQLSGALQRRTYISKEEKPLTKELIKKLYEKAGDFKILLTGYLWTGCRLNELVTIKKSYYNPQEKTLYIDGTKTPTSKRTVPVFPPLEKILNKLVITNPEDERMFGVSEKTIKRRHREIKIRTGINFTLKSLRHTYNQMLKEMGIPDITRAKWMGHSTPATTNKVYTHNTEVLQKQAIDTVLKNIKKYID